MDAVLLSSALVTITLLMAVVSGMNDGGVLMALAVRYPVFPLLWFAGIICTVLVVGPLLLGQSVARTLQSGLFGRQHGTESAFLIGVAVALAVVLALNRWGLPTSLTLALVGGLSGAAWGAGLGVAWGSVGRVLMIGALAPAVGGFAGLLVGRLVRFRTPDRRRRSGSFRVLHLAAFILQCLAYSANDGQKMLAVAAVAGTSLPGTIVLFGPGGNVWALAAVLAGLMLLFCAGMLVSIRTVTPKIASGLATLRPIDAVSAEVVGAASVLASSAIGVPVSMTQATAGAVVGAVSSKSARRVRWESATRIVAAWLVTLPATVVGGFLFAILAKLTR